MTEKTNATPERVYDLHCVEPWFSLVRDGVKPVEGRRASEKYKVLRPGDQLRFYNGDDSFLARIEAIRRYASVEEYLTAETLEKALPGVSTIEEGVRIYLQWSTPKEIKDDGFLAIQIARTPKEH